MRGWMAEIARAPSTPILVNRYADLKRMLTQYTYIAVLDFDTKAADEFTRLRKAHPRSGTMDLKIAAIALANGATLLSRNTGDFDKIAGLTVADWSV